MANTDTDRTCESILAFASNLYEKEDIKVKRSNEAIIEITVKNPFYLEGKTKNRAKFLSVYHDHNGEYYMSIENFHWEFNKDYNAAKRTVQRHLQAMYDDKLRIKHRLLQRWITFGKDIYIQE